MLFVDRDEYLVQVPFLAEAHLVRGDKVYIPDDLSTGTLENISHLHEHATYRDRLFVTIDTVLHDDETLELVGTCNIVVYLAAAGGVSIS
jgi:UDP-glucose 4-epimerase